MKTIGIPVNFRETEHYIQYTYLEYLRKSGYKPQILLPDDDGVYTVDGILLPGGTDIDPTLFGYDNTSSFSCQSDMDLFWFDLVEKAVENKIPVFGICRGHQFLFYALRFMSEDDKIWDKFYYAQDIDGHNQSDLKVLRPRNFHFVEYLDHQTIPVNSFHHQAVMIDRAYFRQQKADDIYKALGVATTSHKSFHVVESAEINFKGWKAQSVQWHPEELAHKYLLKNFFGD